jgi:hypothetical protein
MGQTGAETRPREGVRAVDHEGGGNTCEMQPCLLGLGHTVADKGNATRAVDDEPGAYGDEASCCRELAKARRLVEEVLN